MTPTTLDQITDTLAQLRARRPLVHCLTNAVVKNYTANVLLAIGASPAMVEDIDEAAQFAAIADALLINPGTLTPQQEETIHAAIAAANKASKPWTLDPVAIGAITKRTDLCKKIITQHPAIIRGNASEIITLAGHNGHSRGTDSTATANDALDAAKQLARQTAATILVTGETDHITDGNRTATIANGHPLMTRVTGIGCAMGALAAACSAVAPDRYTAAIATAALFGIAGELAAQTAPRPGSFQIAFLDALDQLDTPLIRKHAKIN